MKLWSEKATAITRRSFVTTYVLQLHFSIYEEDPRLVDKVVSIDMIAGRAYTNIEQVRKAAKDWVAKGIGRRANIYERKIVYRYASDPSTKEERHSIEERIRDRYYAKT